jgi:hypothetical protein
LGRAAKPLGGTWAPAKALPAVVARGLSFFNGEPRRASKFDDKLDMSHLLTQSAWTREELDGVEKTHREPRDWVDRAAYYTVQGLRGAFDLCSMYKVRTMTDQMHERDWIRRVIFLETVAGVPGMVAGMLRHLHSLRLMRRDYGWIHALLSEAENERMHLLIALSLRQPGPLFRVAVIGGQGVFLTWYSIAYLLSPRYCHRFVGYLEEEAVHTYSKLLEDIDAGKLPSFASLKAPRIARIYYNLPADAMLRDVFERIRADEGAHRDTNHHFGDLKPDEPNTMVEHLRRAHFQHSNVFSGLAVDKELESKELDDLKTFREQLGTKSRKSAQPKQDPGAV